MSDIATLGYTRDQLYNAMGIPPAFMQAVPKGQVVRRLKAVEVVENLPEAGPGEVQVGDGDGPKVTVEMRVVETPLSSIDPLQPMPENSYIEHVYNVGRQG